MNRVSILFFIFLLFLYGQKSFASEQNLFIGFYGAQASHGDLIDLLGLKYESMQTYLYAITFGKKFPNQKNRYRFETEV